MTSRANFLDRLAAQQEPLGAEFQRVLVDNLPALYSRDEDGVAGAVPALDSPEWHPWLKTNPWACDIYNRISGRYVGIEECREVIVSVAALGVALPVKDQS